LNFFPFFRFFSYYVTSRLVSHHYALLVTILHWHPNMVVITP
jgi:hypothetical protein